MIYNKPILDQGKTFVILPSQISPILGIFGTGPNRVIAPGLGSGNMPESPYIGPLSAFLQ